MNLSPVLSVIIISSGAIALHSGLDILVGEANGQLFSKYMYEDKVKLVSYGTT